MTHHSVVTSSLRIKILKIDKFVDFSSEIDINYNITNTDIFSDVISLIINQCDPGDRRDPLADTKCPPAPQYEQANCA